MKKPKDGPLLRFEVRNAFGRAIRDEAGKRVVLASHTLKAARHRAKAMYGNSVIVLPEGASVDAV